MLKPIESRTLVLVLLLIAMASPLALNIFVPAMPDAARHFGVPISVIQLSFTVYLFMLAIGQLLTGSLADYFGRRPLMIAGLITHTCGSLLALAASDVTFLILGRALQALGGSAGMVLARTVILDLYGRQGAAGKMGYIVMAIAISQTIAPMLGGHMNLWFSWHSVFYISVLIGVSATLLVAFTLPETIKEKSSSIRLGAMIGRYKNVLQSRSYLGYTLSTTFIAATFYTFMGSAPYLVDAMGENSATFGNWFLFVSVAFMAGSYLSTRLSSLLSIDRAVLTGNCCSLFGATLMLLAALSSSLSLVTLFIPIALVTFGRGLSQPNAQTAAIGIFPSFAATASGFMGFIQLITGAIVAQFIPVLIAAGPAAVVSCLFLGPLIALLAHRQLTQ